MEWTEKKYGNMIIIWGKNNDYLSMNIDYSTPREIKISMETYL